MKTVAMIPIKLNSERVKNKNIKLLSDGKPLIEFIQNALLKAKGIDEIYVYCSEDKIKKYLLPGIRYLKRKKSLDEDNINCNDIIEEFMQDVKADYFVVCHATALFTKSQSIEKCLEIVKEGLYDSAFTAYKIQNFLWCKGKAINFDLQHFSRTQDLEPIYSESAGAFAFTKETFEKYHRRVGNKPYICEVSAIEGCDIDTVEDFIIADAIYMAQLKGENLI